MQSQMDQGNLANGLLRIQDILRPHQGAQGGGMMHPGMMGHHPLHQLQHHQLAHHLQQHNNISPPIGPDQSPPATPPMHSPDSMKGGSNKGGGGRDVEMGKGSPDSNKGKRKDFCLIFWQFVL
jgi:hypothetical protein